MQASTNTFSNFASALYQVGISTLGLLRPWLIAACLLFSSILLLPSISQLADSYLVLLKYLPYGLGTLVILLGQQFVQGRIAMAAVNLVIGYGLIQTYLQAPLSQASISAYFTLLSLYWPLNFFIIYWLPERKLLSPLGLLLAVIIGLEILSGYLLVHQIQDYPQLLSQYFSLQPFAQHSEHLLSGWLLPLAHSLVIAIAAFMLFIHTLYKRDRNHSVILASLIASCLVCGWFDQAGISSLFTSLIACALLVTLFFNSYDLAFLDELTGLPGRRALMNELKHCGKQYCVVMADIDHFKQFNDTHGHDTGDDVLKIVAQELAKVRGGKAYRYGGEEFTLLFKRKTLEQAEPFIEEIRESIANYPLVIRDKKTRPKKKTQDKAQGKAGAQMTSHHKTVQITVSFGIAQRQSEQKPEQVMKSADQALYRAKEQGRNCLSR